MPTSTKVHVVLQDVYGYGHDSIFGVYIDQAIANKHIDEYIEVMKPRYVRGDFIVLEERVII